MTPEARVDHYADLVGGRFGLVGELPGGRALQIADETGRHFVLKWDHDEASKATRRRAIGIAERLGAEAGWPVPAFDIAEDDVWLFVRQQLMPGTEPTELTESLWNQVFELTEATAGLGVGSVNDWPERLVDTLVAEPIRPTVYCDHEPLRRHSEVGRELIQRIEGIGAVDLEAADDLMHWDLHLGNLLVVDGRISAVIDLDNAGPGPRGFDLITFAMSSHPLPGPKGFATAMLDDARRQVSDALADAAIAHLILRFSNWALRTGQAEVADYWIARGQRLLLK